MNLYRLRAAIGRGRTLFVHVNAVSATNALKLAKIECGALAHYWEVLRSERSYETVEGVTLKYT